MNKFARERECFCLLLWPTSTVPYCTFFYCSGFLGRMFDVSDVITSSPPSSKVVLYKVPGIVPRNTITRSSQHANISCTYVQVQDVLYLSSTEQTHRHRNKTIHPATTQPKQKRRLLLQTRYVQKQLKRSY